jgi:hypothetical protein
LYNSDIKFYIYLILAIVAAHLEISSIWRNPVTQY